MDAPLPVEIRSLRLDSDQPVDTGRFTLNVPVEEGLDVHVNLEISAELDASATGDVPSLLRASLWSPRDGEVVELCHSYGALRPGKFSSISMLTTLEQPEAKDEHALVSMELRLEWLQPQPVAVHANWAVLVQFSAPEMPSNRTELGVSLHHSDEAEPNNEP